VAPELPKANWDLATALNKQGSAADEGEDLGSCESTSAASGKDHTEETAGAASAPSADDHSGTSGTSPSRPAGVELEPTPASSSSAARPVTQAAVAAWLPAPAASTPLVVET
ncbi:unnamed protein product, partial [Polarella glacialis]